MTEKINVVNKNGLILKTIFRRIWSWEKGVSHVSYNGTWYVVKTCPEKQLQETKDLSRFYIQI